MSTEWDELLIPFSSLCQNSTVNIEGYRIQVSENRTLSSVKRVQPIMHNHERLFCEHHMLRAYTTEQKLQQAIQEHITSFETKGIYDYVLVILKAPKNHREKSLLPWKCPTSATLRKIEPICQPTTMNTTPTIIYYLFCKPVTI